jgi:hypothetical protein
MMGRDCGEAEERFVVEGDQPVGMRDAQLLAKARRGVLDAVA